MPLLPLGDHAIAYEVQGNGPTLVILRGLGRTMRHWFGYDKFLAEHFRVITMDLRGIGATTLPLNLTDGMTTLASDVIRVLDAESVNKAHILGVSLGGMVSLATGLQYPERCHSLITINTSIAGQRTLRITPKALVTLRHGLSGNLEKLNRSLADLLTGDLCSVEEREKFAEMMHEVAEEQGLFALTTIRQLLMAARFRIKKHLPQLKVPTLLLYGTHDKFVPNINTRKLYQLLPHARLVPLAGAGHEPTLDHPELLREVLINWVDEFAHPVPAAARS